MSVELFRIDDRLIHGQVVVGWGQPLRVGFIALVDNEVAASDWEQELYRMGVPSGVDVYFDTLEDAVRKLPDYLADDRRGIVLTGDVETMRELAERSGRVEQVNLGGLHHRPGRVERLRYVFLTAADEDTLRAMRDAGIDVTAQDVPAAAPVPLAAVLDGRGAA
ncbi:MAG TPA: PTS sugar transporter subunit IIB [Gemmatimonadaceae bacterium]|nr:PTS sugar transporter subunit IIB [Gemmatimonadaceae bacterium]